LRRVSQLGKTNFQIIWTAFHLIVNSDELSNT
jgi:hypothetical protein